MLRSLRRAMDGGPDALIRAAAADVGHRRVDVGVRRVRGLREQRGRGHDLARLAIAALRYVFRDPRLLHRMRAVPGEALDGRHALAGGRGDRQHAGARRDALQVHGAGAALRDAAAELRAGEPERVAQHPEERGVGRDGDCLAFAVDGEGNRGHDDLSSTRGMVNNVHRRPARGKGGAAVVSRGNGQAAGVRSLVPPLRIAERGKGGEVSRAVTTYARRLGLFSGTMAVIGGIIGAGIFRSPPVVAQRVGTAGLTLAAWGLGGVIALAGGLCFGELGARKPQAGGGYVYLRDAFGPLPAFLYGWALLLVIATGAIGAVAVTFATYVLALAGLSDRLTIPVAVGAIAFLTGINYVGVKPAAVTQNIFTVLKLAALAALIAAGLFVAASTPFYPPLPPSTARGGAVDVIVALGAAWCPSCSPMGGGSRRTSLPRRSWSPSAICRGRWRSASPSWSPSISSRTSSTCGCWVSRGSPPAPRRRMT